MIITAYLANLKDYFCDITLQSTRPSLLEISAKPGSKKFVLKITRDKEKYRHEE